MINTLKLSKNQLVKIRHDIRQKYRNGTLEQELIDALDADPDWKWEPNKPKTTKQFIAEVAEKNPNIEVIGEYVNRKTHIDVRCKVCDFRWSPPACILLGGSGCPKCAKAKISRPVRCIETGEAYPSITAAAEAVGLKTSAPISQVLHGRAKTAAGYHWEYADDVNDKNNPKTERKNNHVQILRKDIREQNRTFD